MEQHAIVRYLFLALLLFLPVTAFAAPQPVLLGFADTLAREGDHYRAITEYKRFIYSQPNSELVPRARLSIARSLLAGKRWQEADEALETLLLLNPESTEAASGRLLYADSAYDRGDFALARERFRTLLQSTQEPETIDYANFRIGWSFLEQNRTEQARVSFSELPPREQEQLLAGLEQFESLPQKSPRLAGVLSALLPGAGQAYTGRYRQAAAAFLLNGAFILGALEAFDNDNNAVGGILLFFELGWYGGNIYNATNNAYKYNQRVRHEFKKTLRERVRLQAGLLDQTPILGFRYSF